MLSNLNLTDMETCYKAFRREIIQKIDLQENRFGFGRHGMVKGAVDQATAVDRHRYVAIGTRVASGQALNAWVRAK